MDEDEDDVDVDGDDTDLIDRSMSLPDPFLDRGLWTFASLSSFHSFILPFPNPIIHFQMRSDVVRLPQSMSVTPATVGAGTLT